MRWNPFKARCYEHNNLSAVSSHFSPFYATPPNRNALARSYHHHRITARPLLLHCPHHICEGVSSIVEPGLRVPLTWRRISRNLALIFLPSPAQGAKQKSDCNSLLPPMQVLSEARDFLPVACGRCTVIPSRPLWGIGVHRSFLRPTPACRIVVVRASLVAAAKMDKAA